MKKLLLSATVILSFIFYGFHQRSEDTAVQILPPKGLSVSISTPQPSATPSAALPTPTATPEATYQAAIPTDTPTPTSTPTATPIPTPNPTPTPSGKYKDGTYTGSVADAYYGNIQVQATIQGGKITAVDFLQYPNDRSTSVRINSQAMPYLQQEAIQAQSAQVDGVSGASDTSQAFRESLAAALSQAS